MIARYRILLSFVVAALLPACSGMTPRIEASPGMLSTVKTIAVVSPPEPLIYHLINFLHPAMAIPLVGPKVAEADLVLKGGQLSRAFNAQGVAVIPNLTNRIVALLATAGFESRPENAPWEEVNGRPTLAFDQINSTADAVLVISPTIVGFVMDREKAHYIPTVTVVATLVGKDRKEHLYRGFHVSGREPMVGSWRVSPPKLTFADFAALMSDTKAAAAALNEAALAIAETVGADFRK